MTFLPSRVVATLARLTGCHFYAVGFVGGLLARYDLTHPVLKNIGECGQTLVKNAELDGGASRGGSGARLDGARNQPEKRRFPGAVCPEDSGSLTRR